MLQQIEQNEQTVNVHVDTTAQAEQPESALRAEFTVPGRLKYCTDSDSTRYAIDNALVTPADDGVFVAATDSRIACVLQVDGHCDAQHYIPHELLPRRKSPETLQLNGRWESDRKQFAEPVDGAGRFPDIAGAIPCYDDSECIKLSIDRQLFSRLADAVGTNTDRRGLTLLIPRPEGNEYVTGPVVVIGVNGYGAIMPLGPDNVRQNGPEIDQFERQHAEFAEQSGRYRNQPIGQPLD